MSYKELIPGYPLLICGHNMSQHGLQIPSSPKHINGIWPLVACLLIEVTGYIPHAVK